MEVKSAASTRLEVESINQRRCLLLAPVPVAVLNSLISADNSDILIIQSFTATFEHFPNLVNCFGTNPYRRTLEVF
jgi:hypothetical protein